MSMYFVPQEVEEKKRSARQTTKKKKRKKKSLKWWSATLNITLLIEPHNAPDIKQTPCCKKKKPPVEFKQWHQRLSTARLK